MEGHDRPSALGEEGAATVEYSLMLALVAAALLAAAAPLSLAIRSVFASMQSTLG